MTLVLVLRKSDANNAMMLRRRPEQRMMSHAHFAWYELVTADMAAARSYMEGFWDGPRTMPRHRNLLRTFSTPGDAPVCGSWSRRWGGGAGGPRRGVSDRRSTAALSAT